MANEGTGPRAPSAVWQRVRGCRRAGAGGAGTMASRAAALQYGPENKQARRSGDLRAWRERPFAGARLGAGLCCVCSGLKGRVGRPTASLAAILALARCGTRLGRWREGKRTCCLDGFPIEKAMRPGALSGLRARLGSGSSPRSLSRSPALGASHEAGCRFPDAIHRGKRWSRSHSRTVAGVAARDSRVRPLGPVRWATAVAHRRTGWGHACKLVPRLHCLPSGRRRRDRRPLT